MRKLKSPLAVSFSKTSEITKKFLDPSIIFYLQKDVRFKVRVKLRVK
jgi:hypothetical protein